MRAIIATAFGGPDVLKLGDLPVPVPGPGALRVRVVATSTNPVDAKLRADGSWAGLTPPVVLGYDVSGVVDAVGPGVRDFQTGDEVFYTPEIFGNPQGSYAEYNVVPERIVAKKPKNLSHIEAAAVPLAGGTAWEAIIRRLALKPGESVLIQGGAGGVGSFAIQFAKAAGAYVLATAGPANQAFLRELGADVALDYTRGDVAEAVLRETGAGVDALFDAVGSETVAHSLRAVKPFGRIATILDVRGDVSSLFTRNQTLYGIFLTRERRRLLDMTPLFERGLAKPRIESVLPLEQAAAAHARLDSHHGRGKIVLNVA